METLALRIHHSWDEALLCTAQSRPMRSEATLLAWTLQPPAVDAGVPGQLVGILSQVVSSLGPVAFRIFFRENLPAGLELLPAPGAWWLAAMWRRITRTWPADVAIATDAAGVAGMFHQDWQLQGQLALVLDGGGLQDETLAALRTARDWSDRPFPAGVRLLVAPSVDGDAILLAAAGAEELERALDLLSQAASKAGLAVAFAA